MQPADTMLSMTSDLDIRCTAVLLAKHYGDGAPAHAAKRTAELPAVVDLEGRGVWLRISSALEAHLRERADHDPLH